MKTWEEMTKLNKIDISKIIFHILMAIFSIAVSITEKDFTWIVVALLWANITIIEYCDSKLLKGKNALSELQEEHIKLQDEMIMRLLKDLATPNIVIDINLIKIPKNFTKPKKEKLNERFEFYNKHKYFEVPIIIDPSNTLVDGYTSYLIAKKYNLKTVQAKVRIGGQSNEII